MVPRRRCRIWRAELGKHIRFSKNNPAVARDTSPFASRIIDYTTNIKAIGLSAQRLVISETRAIPRLVYPSAAAMWRRVETPLDLQKEQDNAALKRLLRNCAVPPGLGLNFPLNPALRLRLRAGLKYSVPTALGCHGFHTTAENRNRVS